MKIFDLPSCEFDAFLFLQHHGVVHGERRCVNGHAMDIKMERGMWRCLVKNCRKEKGLRADTWLDNCKLPFVTFVRFLYSWAYEMTTIKFCERELEINKNTVVDRNNMIREVCAKELLANLVKIGSPGKTVEIDESVFSRRKSDRGRMLPEQWVFGGICRETKGTFLYAVENRTEATLMECIKESILPGTHIISDCWRAYLSGIPKLVDENGVPLYTHSTVNYSSNFVDPEDGSHTNSIESSWNVAKSAKRRRWGSHRSMLDSYLCEYMYRRRYRDPDVFSTILRHIALLNPPK